VDKKGIGKEDNVIYVDFSSEQKDTESGPEEFTRLKNSMSKDLKRTQRVVLMGSALSISAALIVLVILAAFSASL